MVRVLVIDDEPDVLLLCRVNLRHEGHEVFEAPDGESGLVLAARARPDLIVLDLMLPSIDGYEVLAALREDEATREVPVLVLTAKAQLQDRRRSLESGGDAYLTKPFAPDELGSLVRELAGMDADARAAARAAALRAIEDDGD